MSHPTRSTPPMGNPGSATACIFKILMLIATVYFIVEKKDKSNADNFLKYHWTMNESSVQIFELNVQKQHNTDVRLSFFLVSFWSRFSHTSLKTLFTSLFFKPSRSSTNLHGTGDGIRIRNWFLFTV